MIRKLSALALAATGCFSIPPFEPQGGVSYSAEGTGGVVKGPGFELRFADGPGFHFPNSLMIGGTEVIGHEVMPGCFKEDEVGFRFSPTPRISPTGGAPAMKNVLEPVLRGPGVVQVKLDWSTTLACNAERIPGGTSTFTVFPDGRIMRHDFIHDPGKPNIAPLPCACEWDEMNPEYQVLTFATYWTLARSLFRDLLRGDMLDDPVPLPANGAPPISNTDMSCVQALSDEFQVTFAWRVPNPSDPNDSTIRGGDALVGFGRDLRRGASDLGSFTLTGSGAVFIGSKDSDCLKQFVRSDEYAYPLTATLRVAGAAEDREWIAEDRDGIYGGDNGTTGPGIDLTQDSAELTGTVRTPFAVWLRFPRPVKELRARRDSATGAWYLPQQVDDRSWIVWFRDPLRDTEKITVEPR